MWEHYKFPRIFSMGRERICLECLKRNLKDIALSSLKSDIGEKDKENHRNMIDSQNLEVRSRLNNWSGSRNKLFERHQRIGRVGPGSPIHMCYMRDNPTTLMNTAGRSGEGQNPCPSKGKAARRQTGIFLVTPWDFDEMAVTLRKLNSQK